MRAGDLHIWCARTPVPYRDLVPGADAWLDARERRCARRRGDPAARDQYRFAHQFLRWVLASYLGRAERDVPICLARSGKPAVSTVDSALRFNLSHTHGRVAIAVSYDRQVGIDIESVASLGGVARAPFAMLDAAFSAAEKDALRAVAPDRRRSEIVRLWTLKEALAKADGRGLAIPLRRLNFPVVGQPVVVDAGTYDDRWSFVCLPLGTDGWLSAAIAAPPGVTQVCIVDDRPRCSPSAAVYRVVRNGDGLPDASAPRVSWGAV